MILSKTKLKILSWVDIVLGVILSILGALGSILFLFSAELPRAIAFDVFSGLILGLLMIVTGVVLIKSRLGGYPIKVGWFLSIFGVLNIIISFYTPFLSTQPLYSNIPLVIGLIIGEIGLILMALGGYLLRKLI